MISEWSSETGVGWRSERSQTGVGQRSDNKKIVRRVSRGKVIDKLYAVDKIIRLSCIEGNTRLIYRRFG